LNTAHPTSEWVVQQEVGPNRYVILDRASKFNAIVIAFLKSTGLTPKRTSVQVPWQNGIAERSIGSCRRELLDHVIASVRAGSNKSITRVPRAVCLFASTVSLGPRFCATHSIRRLRKDSR
jgi:hypothetical protein